MLFVNRTKIVLVQCECIWQRLDVSLRKISHSKNNGIPRINFVLGQDRSYGRKKAKRSVSRSRRGDIPGSLKSGYVSKLRAIEIMGKLFQRIMKQPPCGSSTAEVKLTAWHAFFISRYQCIRHCRVHH